MNWLKLPKKIYFKRGGAAVALKEFKAIYGFQRALIITDSALYQTDEVTAIQELIRKQGIRIAEYFVNAENVSIASAFSGLPKMNEFQPDVIVAVGGKNIISLAKIMNLIYEYPDTDVAALADKYSKADCLDTDYTFPVLGGKCKLVTVAASDFSGYEFTPFAVIKDDASGKNIAISSYQFIPEMAIVDAELLMNASSDVIKASGLNTLSLAVKAYVSEDTTDYVRGFARDAAKIVFKYLPRACENGSKDPDAIVQLASASAYAGMAYGNACSSIDPDGVSLADENSELLAELASYCGIEDWNSACEAL